MFQAVLFIYVDNSQPDCTRGSPLQLWWHLAGEIREQNIFLKQPAFIKAEVFVLFKMRLLLLKASCGEVLQWWLVNCALLLSFWSHAPAGLCRMGFNGTTLL